MDHPPDKDNRLSRMIALSLSRRKKLWWYRRHRLLGRGMRNECIDRSLCCGTSVADWSRIDDFPSCGELALSGILELSFQFFVRDDFFGGARATIKLEKPESKRMTAREGFVIVAISWILFSFFGSLPFVINSDIPSFVDAFFETSSGFTTTGASILDDVESYPHSSLFWRSFTHLVGGMGIFGFCLGGLAANRFPIR